MQSSSDRAKVDSQLLDFVKQLERNYFDWRAVHLHLSQLRAQNRRSYQLRVAASEFDGLLRRFRSELFELSNGDVVFLWHGAGRVEVDPVVMRLRYLFSDDPLANATDSVTPEHMRDLVEPGLEAPGGGKFCTWFELEREYDRLRMHLETLLESLGELGAASAADQPLDPGRLAQLESSLASMNLSGLSRRQSICALLPKNPPQPLYNEIYIAVRELAQALAPGIDLTADTWLFHRLAELLDRRLLTCLAKGDLKVPQGSISLNLRLPSLLTPEFLKFDHDFRRKSGQPVIIELQLIDIFAELGAYMFIREFVRDRGYMICIDGLHHLHLPLIERRRLGADLIKMIWSPDLQDGLNGERAEKLRSAIKRAGYDRVILCRCDTTEAIRWGQSFGIRLFQGHYIDSRLRAARPPAVAAARQAMRGTK